MNFKVLCEHEGSLLTTHKRVCKQVFLYARYPQMLLLRKERKVEAFASLRLESQDLTLVSVSDAFLIECHIEQKDSLLTQQR